jgi:hypothetical protein
VERSMGNHQSVIHQPTTFAHALILSDADLSERYRLLLSTPDFGGHQRLARVGRADAAGSPTWMSGSGWRPPGWIPRVPLPHLNGAPRAHQQGGYLRGALYMPAFGGGSA